MVGEAMATIVWSMNVMATANNMAARATYLDRPGPSGRSSEPGAGSVDMVRPSWGLRGTKRTDRRRAARARRGTETVHVLRSATMASYVGSRPVIDADSHLME